MLLKYPEFHTCNNEDNFFSGLTRNLISLALLILWKM
jgi:hypothetical protein